MPRHEDPRDQEISDRWRNEMIESLFEACSSEDDLENSYEYDLFLWDADDYGPVILEKKNILKDLKKDGVIIGFKIYEEEQSSEYSPSQLEFAENPEKYYDPFVNTEENQSATLLMAKVSFKPKIVIEHYAKINDPNNTVTLAKDGTLYREVRGSRLEVIFSQSSKRYDAIHLLVENQGGTYTPTEEITTGRIGNEEEGPTDKANTRKELGKMNKRIKEHLALSADFIENKLGSGYRINPKFKVVRATK